MGLWAFIGIGNPGPKYEKTRHNVGFWVIDALQASLKAGKFQNKSDCEYLKIRLSDEEDVLLVKPQLYMNLSGEAAVPLLRFFKIAPSQTVVFHDDADLESGALKIKKGGGSGGHHGIDDMALHFGTPEFYRIRIGIGRPEHGEREVSNWVLTAPKGDERDRLLETVIDAGKCAELLVKEGLEKASQKFARKAFRGA